MSPASLTLLPKRAHGQRGAGRLAVLAPIALVLLALVLVARGDWLALLILPLAAWPLKQLLHPQPDPLTTVAGPHPLLTRLLPLWSAHIDTAEQGLSAGMAEALDSFQHMLGEQRQLQKALVADPVDLVGARAALAALDPHIETAMHALQVGDRIHQLLEIVKADQRRLASQLHQLDAADDAAVERWLADLQARYTTDEQRILHGGANATSGTPGVQYF